MQCYHWWGYNLQCGSCGAKQQYNHKVQLQKTELNVVFTIYMTHTTAYPFVQLSHAFELDWVKLLPQNFSNPQIFIQKLIITIKLYGQKKQI